MRKMTPLWTLCGAYCLLNKDLIWNKWRNYFRWNIFFYTWWFLSAKKRTWWNRLSRAQKRNHPLSLIGILKGSWGSQQTRPKVANRDRTWHIGLYLSIFLYNNFTFSTMNYSLTVVNFYIPILGKKIAGFVYLCVSQYCFETVLFLCSFDLSIDS